MTDLLLISLASFSATTIIIALTRAFLCPTDAKRKLEVEAMREAKDSALAGFTPISLEMATYHENAKFRIRYQNLREGNPLYAAGLRNGQYGCILKSASGMFAKTTIKGSCKFMPITHINYIPEGE